MPEYGITDHARARFAELGPVGASLHRQLNRSVPVGGQKGRGWMRSLPCGLVAAGVERDGKSVVTTILTKDHAIANMQSRNIKVVPVTPAAKVQKAVVKQATPVIAVEKAKPEPVPYNPDLCVKNDELLLRFAIRHAMHRLTLNERRDECVAAGIKADSHKLLRYSVAYEAAKRTLASLELLLKEAVMSGPEIDERLRLGVHQLWGKLTKAYQETEGRAMSDDEEDDDTLRPITDAAWDLLWAFEDLSQEQLAGLPTELLKAIHKLAGSMMELANLEEVEAYADKLEAKLPVEPGATETHSER